MNKIIQDYGATVDPGVYIRALQGHQYIPQADQCIRDVVHRFGVSSDFPLLGIADLGCGPGRLTFGFSHHKASVLGLDMSASFIQYAQQQHLARENFLPGPVEFMKLDFITDKIPPHDDPIDPDGKWRVLVAQGVLHHIHGDDRVTFLKRCHEILHDDGIFVVGDEFIADYKTSDERQHRVAGFYLHIIAEAVKGGFIELANEEAKNLIDDVFSGEKGCGHADELLIRYIQDSAIKYNREFYMGLRKDEPMFLADDMHEFIKRVRGRAESLADEVPEENFNRGDYKVSIEVLLREMEPYGFKLKERYEIGPVEQLGGMGVLVFVKS